MRRVHDIRKKINKLISFSKNSGEGYRFILDSRRASRHLIEPRYTELPHHELFTRLETAESEDTYVIEVDGDDLPHLLRIVELLRISFRLLQIYIYENRWMWWPRPMNASMKWFRSVTISQSMHGGLLFSEALMDRDRKEKKDTRKHTEKAVLAGTMTTSSSFIRKSVS